MKPIDIQIEKHPWQPFLPTNAKILFLGTFPPKENRWGIDFYYPNKINDFWRIMGMVFFNRSDYFINDESKQFDKTKIIKHLTKTGIALGDTGYEVKRLKDNASDKYLEIVTPINLNEVLAKIPSCTTIASTGQKAAEIISTITQSPIPQIGKSTLIKFNNRDLRIYRMPSTSRAYPLAIDKKTAYYRAMFKEINLL